MAELRLVRPMRLFSVLIFLACIHVPLLAAPPTVIQVEQAKKNRLLLSAPFPDYSFEARRQRLEGSGVFHLKFDFPTGHLREIHAVRSTGHALLDSSCIRAFKRWKAKPRSIYELRVPATFTLAR